MWITCDVSSLYSSILHTLAIEAVNYYLEHHMLTLEVNMFVLDVLQYLLPSMETFFFRSVEQ